MANPLLGASASINNPLIAKNPSYPTYAPGSVGPKLPTTTTTTNKTVPIATTYSRFGNIPGVTTTNVKTTTTSTPKTTNMYAPGTVGPKLPTMPTKTTAPSSAANYGSGVLGIGSTGTSVAALQKQLGISADGIYGPQTQAAVEAYQRAHGLQVDGLAGPQTMSALTRGTASSPKPAPTGTPTKSVPAPVSMSTAPAPAPASAPSSSGSSVPSQQDQLQALFNQLLQTINGNGSDQTQLQTEAQQEAQAQYQQQLAAYQQQVQALKDQQGQTNAGYQQQLNSALNTLNDTSFQDYLQGREDMAQRGLATSGLNDAQNTQLALAQQQQAGTLEGQESQQVAANNASYGDQENSINSEMSQLNPQSLYDQYLQSLQTSAQSAQAQRVSQLQSALGLMAPYESMTADQQATNAVAQQNSLNAYLKNVWDAQYQQGQLANTQTQLGITASDDAAKNQVAQEQVNEKIMADQATIAEFNSKALSSTQQAQWKTYSDQAAQAASNMRSAMSSGNPSAYATAQTQYNYYTKALNSLMGQASTSTVGN